MATLYRYTAIDKDGTKVQGELSAVGDLEVAVALKSRNLTVISIDDFSDHKGAGPFKQKNIGLREKILFTTYIATMVKAGSPLIGGIDVLLSDTKDKNFIHFLERTKSGLEKGQLLSDLLSLNTESFDRSFIAVVRAGETSGQLR